MARSRVVKVRVTEAEYSDWTEMARSRSVSLSETIRRAMQGNPQPESPKPLESLPVAQDESPGKWAGGVEIIPLSYEEGSGLVNRRKSLCPHGKPGFAFCPECDS